MCVGAIGLLVGNPYYGFQLILILQIKFGTIPDHSLVSCVMCIFHPCTFPIIRPV